ncbi:MAG: N-acetyltransferase, partial [Bacteroidales bacterium]|nr:N-acetyltransferase [Bacteroidales bacterium]
DGYPSELVILADVTAGNGFVIEEDGQIVAYFALISSPEPTYNAIYGGEWLDGEKPYHVIHRIVSTPESHGVFDAIMDYAFSVDGNIRIDTHKDNTIMQHNILKHGFSYCGIIYLLSGDERLAYQKILK